MKKVFLLIFTLVQALFSFSQVDSTFTDTTVTDTVPKAVMPTRYHVAVFVPLYLDSAFNSAHEYRFGAEFPKYLNPGLEFYEGVELAVDSMEKEGLQMDVHIFDTHSAGSTVKELVQNGELADMNLLIGHVTMNEAAWLAYYAKKMNIPFINANLPNEAGVKDNPDFVLLNSTLFTHCEGIYKYLQKYYALSPIVVFGRKGAQEDRLKQYFGTIEKNTASVPLKMQYVTLDNNFTAAQLQPYLDEDRPTICLAGSLDLGFGKRLIQQLATVDSPYHSVIVGMPTWDAINLSEEEFFGPDVIYSTPFFIPPSDSLAASINEFYRVNFYSRPSDMVFRGYESIYHYGHLLSIYGSNLTSSLGDKRFNVFYNFDVKPVLNKQTMTLDYFENKKLYFIRQQKGKVVQVVME